MIEEEPAAADSGDGEPDTPLQKAAAVVCSLILALGLLGALIVVVTETSGDSQDAGQVAYDSVTPAPISTNTVTPRATETPRPITATPLLTPDPSRPTPRTSPPEVPSDPIVTSSGLSYVTLVEGDGEAPVPGDTVSVEYNGWLEDGTLFDSTYLPGRRAFTYTVGSGVVAGFDEAVMLTELGGTTLVVIPSELAYGAEGRTGIPPNAKLIFEIAVWASEG